MKVRKLYISEAHVYVGHHGKPAGTAPIVEVPEVECVAGSGLKGDRYFNFKEDYRGQATFFSQEVYEDLCKELDIHDKPTSVFRRNILVEGVDLNDLIGEEFEVQGVRFSGSCEARPCYWMDQAFGPGAHEALKGFGGLRARILTDGILKAEG